MNDFEETSLVSLPVSLCSTTGSGPTRTSDGVLAGILTVPCPMVGDQVLLQRCAFCARNEGLLLDPADGSVSLRCRLPLGCEI